MSDLRGKTLLREYVYDFSVDGGTKDSNIVLSAKAGKSALPVGAIVKSVIAVVNTAVTSDGNATVSWGTITDADGYSGTTIAKASLTANAVFNGWDTGAALLWDDTNDHILNYRVADANGGAFVVLISTADATAGKITFTVEYFVPGIEA
jgi:hypothetical protein